MVELTLPKNSQIAPGATWPKPASANTREFSVYRWSPLGKRLLKISMNSFLIVLSFCAAMAGAAIAETVYLFDSGPGKYSKSLNEITIWKEAAVPQKSNSRLPGKGDMKSVKCFAKGRSSASVIARSGNAFEVKVSGGCRGFVNKKYVHDAK